MSKEKIGQLTNLRGLSGSLKTGTRTLSSDTRIRVPLHGFVTLDPPLGFLVADK